MMGRHPPTHTQCNEEFLNKINKMSGMSDPAAHILDECLMKTTHHVMG